MFHIKNACDYRVCNILNICGQCSANLNSLSDGLVKKGWVDLTTCSNWLMSFKRQSQLVCKSYCSMAV